MSPRLLIKLLVIWNNIPNHLNGIIPDYLISKVKPFPIPISNVKDRLIWKITNYAEFSVWTATSLTIIEY